MIDFTENEKLKEILEALREEPTFPTAHYDRDGDCLEFLNSPEAYWGERVDNLVTVYYGQESSDMIGACIKGVRKLVGSLSQKLPTLSIVIKDGPFHVGVLFGLALSSGEKAPAEHVRLTYRKIIEAAANAQANLDDLLLQP